MGIRKADSHALAHVPTEFAGQRGGIVGVNPRVM